MSDVLATHRAFYDAVETGDLDLMASLWVNDADTSCIHPGAEQLKGTEAVLRSWTLLMANVGYIQFFLTDIAVDDAAEGCRRSRHRGRHLHREHPVRRGHGVRRVVRGRQGHLHQRPLARPERYGRLAILVAPRLPRPRARDRA